MVDHQDLTLELPVTIEAALRRLNENQEGVVFLTKNRTLLGSFTDGDFRRAVLTGGVDPSSPVVDVMNHHPEALPQSASPEETFRALSRSELLGRRILPRIDKDGTIVGFAQRGSWGVTPLAKPDLGGRERELLLSCLEDNWISSTGPYVEQFEQGFATYTGLQNPVAVSNGTVALTVALQALGISAGDEVIVPSLTFAATANAVIAAGGIPVFCDVDPSNWCLNVTTLEKVVTPAVRAVIAVHLYGYPCASHSLRAWCDSRGVLLVEDCAEAIGTVTDLGHAGHSADAATFSFFANKTITTGEGGMTFFADAQAADRAKLLRSHGMNPGRKYWHDVVGFNYRLTNMQAAVGLAQLERLDSFLQKKRSNAALMTELLEAPGNGIDLLDTTGEGLPSFWLFPVSLTGGDERRRSHVIQRMADRGIEVRSSFLPLHLMPPFLHCRHADDMHQSELIGREAICLPNYPQLVEEEIVWIATSLLEAVQSDE